jgi:fructuronate reductase
MRYVTGRDERGQRIEVDDPMAGRLRAIAMSAGNDPGRLVEGYLGVGEVFGEDLPGNDLFRDTLIRHLSSLLQFGTVETVRRFAGW